MNLVPLIRPLLFQLDPEKAHHLALHSLNFLYQRGLLHFLVGKVPQLPTTLCGMQLPNPVGLAAGLDKDGRFIDALATLGFGFLEIGTVTPLPQSGNPKPRMFRLPKTSGIINRMGFNNDGVQACVERVKRSSFYQNGGVIGLNIGKNALTPMADANSDYLICLRAVYEVASYVTINISSPNTKNLRQLQNSQGLEKLLLELTQERTLLSEQYGKKIPLFLKIAPDLEPGQIFEIANLLERFEIDALIATNTTISRENVQSEIDHHQSGGLSGKPIKDLSNQIVATFYRLLEGRTPIIGVGGIHTGTDALQKKNFGAKVIQIYSGLIYEGPQLIKDCINALKP